MCPLPPCLRWGEGTGSRALLAQEEGDGPHATTSTGGGHQAPRDRREATPQNPRHPRVRRRAPPLEREVPSPRGGEGGVAWGRDGGARRIGRAREREGVETERERERGGQ